MKISDYLIDIRNTSLEDIQKVASAISLEVSEGVHDYILESIDKEYELLVKEEREFCTDEDIYVDFIRVLGGLEDEDLVLEEFEEYRNAKFKGILTVSKAIEMFNL